MPIRNGMFLHTEGSKPHVVFVMEALSDAFPYIIWKFGGMVPRTTRNYDPVTGEAIPGNFSAHSVGRAVDIYLSAKVQPDLELGTRLFDMFVKHAAILKVEHVIWNSREWSPKDGGTFLTISSGDSRGPHTDHVHVAFKDDHLDAKPTQLTEIVKEPALWMKRKGYKDYMDGKHGPAFKEGKPLVRVTDSERRRAYAETTGDWSHVTPMALPGRK